MRWVVCCAAAPDIGRLSTQFSTRARNGHKLHVPQQEPQLVNEWFVWMERAKLKARKSSAQTRYQLVHSDCVSSGPPIIGRSFASVIWKRSSQPTPAWRRFLPARTFRAKIATA